MLTKTFPLKEAGFEKLAAEDDTLALINQFALRPLSPDEVYVRRMILANDALDRDNERFSEEVLHHFASSLPGKSFLVGHQHGSAPIGRFFHAEALRSSAQCAVSSEQPTPSPVGAELVSAPGGRPVIASEAWQSPAGGGNTPGEAPLSRSVGEGTGVRAAQDPSPKPQASSLNLIASFYTIKTNDNEGFRQQIDGGVYSFVSIGFRCEKLLCDICGKDMKSTLCPHYPGKAYPPNGGLLATGTWKGQAEALEASLVYLGAQFGAQFVKSPAPDSRLQATDYSQTEQPHEVLRSASGPEPVGEGLCALPNSLPVGAQNFAPATLEAGVINHAPTNHPHPVGAELVSAPDPHPGGEVAHSAQHTTSELSTLNSQFKEHVVRPFRVADASEAEASHYMPETGNLKLETLNSKLAALEALLEAKDRRLDQLSELAEEAKTLRSDLVSHILAKAQLLGLPSLFDQNSLSDLPLPRLKSLLSDLNCQFDRKFPPQGMTTGCGLQATGSGNTHPRSPESGVRSPDLSPFRLP